MEEALERRYNARSHMTFYERSQDDDRRTMHFLSIGAFGFVAVEDGTYDALIDELFLSGFLPFLFQTLTDQALCESEGLWFLNNLCSDDRFLPRSINGDQYHVCAAAARGPRKNRRTFLD